MKTLTAAGLILLAISLPAGAADDVVAQVEDIPITASELNEAISILPDQSQAEILKSENRRKFVENYVTWKLLVNEARKSKVDESPKYVKLVEQAKNEILLALLREKLRTEIEIDEKDVKAFYEAHVKDFTVPERRKISHIQISDEKKAKDVLKRVRGGAKFESEARLHSEHKESAANGGDLGWSEHAELPPEMAKAVFSGKAGKLLDQPLRTRYGWHVIRVDEIAPEKLPAYPEIRDEVRKRALNERMINSLPDMVKRLKEKSEIKIYDQRLNLLGPAQSAK